MRQLVSDRSHDDEFSLVINIVEHSVFADAQSPNREHMFPRRNQTDENFTVARPPTRFVKQLYFDLIKDVGPFRCSKGFQVISYSGGVRDLVHALILSAASTLTVCPTILAITRAERAFFASEGTAADATATVAATGSSAWEATSSWL